MALLQERNNQLERELKKARPELGGVSSNNDSVTFSQELFPSQGLSNMSQSSLDLLNDLLNKTEQAPKTVDPMTISPALSPVPEEQDFDDVATHESESQVPKDAKVSQKATSINPSTQYPAAVLWHDLQCQRPVEMSPWTLATVQTHTTAMVQLMVMAYSLSATFLTCWTHPFSMVSTLLNTSRTTSTTSWPLPHQQTVLISIIRAVTNPLSRHSSSTSSSVPATQATAELTTSRSSKKTLRLRTLRKLLTCNRQLARPLQDATLEVLRLSLAKENGSQVIGQESAGVSVAPALEQVLGLNCPSTERLISLVWAIRTLDRRIKLREQGVRDVKRSKMGRVRLNARRGQSWDGL